MEQGRCREHPDREARVTPCARCGDFRCEECFEFDTDVTLCSSCVPARLPWVKDQSMSALWQTVVLVVTAGPRTFSTAVGTGESQQSASFAGFVGLAGFSPWFFLFLVGTLFLGGEPMGILGAMCGFVICAAPIIVLGQVIRGGLYGFVYHFAASALGGRATSSSSLDASYFSMALTPLLFLSYVVVLIPIVGPLIVLGLLLLVFGWGVHLVAHHAHARHELSWTRAYLAAAAPILLAIFVWFVVVALSIARVASSRAGLE